MTLFLVVVRALAGSGLYVLGYVKTARALFWRKRTAELEAENQRLRENQGF